MDRDGCRLMDFRKYVNSNFRYHESSNFLDRLNGSQERHCAPCVVC